MRIGTAASGTLLAALVGLLVAGCAAPGTQGGEGNSAFGRQSGRDSASVDTVLRLADFTQARGDTSSAIALYRRAHAADPDAVEPLVKLGAVLAQAGSFEEAAGAYRAALAIDARNGLAQRGYGNAELALGRPDVALPHLETALAMSEDGAAFNSVGVALDMLGRHPEAQAQYQRGLAVSPEDLDLATNYSLSLSLQGRYDEAVNIMRQVAASPNATVRHRQNLALVLGLAGRDTEAAAAASGDIGADAARQNVAYYQMLRGVGDTAARATLIGGVDASGG